MMARGVSNMTEAQSVGRAFLASPAATRVAAGSTTRNTVLVKAVYKDKAGRPCRVVEQTVLISGQTVRARGDICRTPGGQWALVSRANGGKEQGSHAASSARDRR
jgi:surface antigen